MDKELDSAHTDIHASRLPADLNWEPAARAPSLNAVFSHALSHAEQVISWYLDAKGLKRICARWLRLAAIALTTIGALMPLFADFIAPFWTTVALALAAMCVGVDRFYGCSSAWMRFMTTEHRVRQHLNGFQIECEALKAQWPEGVPDEEQVQQALARAKQFITEVDEIVRQETAQWSREFSNVITEIDQAAKRSQQA